MFGNRRIMTVLMVVMFIGLMITAIAPAFAQAGINTIQNVKLGNVVQQVISAVLALVGLLAAAYLIYGGVLYLTSGGDTKAADKAKHVILSAIIGIIIIFVSWALVNYVMSSFFGLTSPTKANEIFMNQ